MIVPTSGFDGLYAINVGVTASAAVTQLVDMHILVNGSLVGINYIPVGKAIGDHSIVWPLVAGSTVRCQIYNGDPATLDFTGSMTVYRVAR